MSLPPPEPGHLAACINTCIPDAQAAGLRAMLADMFPEQVFEYLMERGGWHRLGGIVDRDERRISHNLQEWVEQAAGGDAEAFHQQYAEAGYLVTSFSGKTHYLAAATGPGVVDYLQLEVEELQEMIVRPLLDPEEVTDSLEEIIDPLEPVEFEARPLGAPRYLFRRITPIAGLLGEAKVKRRLAGLRRLMQDWQNSSAGAAGPFYHHWILQLQDVIDEDETHRIGARPVPVRLPETNPFNDREIVENSVGAKLANALHNYNDQVGYPMAWFFHMLTTRQVPFELANAVWKDHQQGFNYLPAQDQAVLRAWAENPYAL